MIYERRSPSALGNTDIQQKLVNAHVSLYLQGLSTVIDKQSTSVYKSQRICAVSGTVVTEKGWRVWSPLPRSLQPTKAHETYPQMKQLANGTKQKHLYSSESVQECLLA